MEPVSDMKFVGYLISLEDINLKFLRSLTPKWSMHTVVWRNKPDFEKMSLDNLYNNLKVYESEMKVTSTSSSAAQNLAFVSSNNKGSQETHSAAYGVSTASTNGSAAGSSSRVLPGSNWVLACEYETFGF